MTGLFEGVGIALTSLRAHKMRAAADDPGGRDRGDGGHGHRRP